jgi:hypothetical protein
LTLPIPSTVTTWCPSMAHRGVMQAFTALCTTLPWTCSSDPCVNHACLARTHGTRAAALAPGAEHECPAQAVHRAPSVPRTTAASGLQFVHLVVVGHGDCASATSALAAAELGASEATRAQPVEQRRLRPEVLAGHELALLAIDKQVKAGACAASRPPPLTQRLRPSALRRPCGWCHQHVTASSPVRVSCKRRLLSCGAAATSTQASYVAAMREGLGSLEESDRRGTYVQTHFIDFAIFDFLRIYNTL